MTGLRSLLFTALTLAACATPPLDFGPVETLATSESYYPDNHIDFDDSTLMIVTLSGGGMRAAALSQGVLEALDAVPHKGGTLLDEIDIVSSTSGGSAAAANLVLNGRAGFGRFREEFLYRDLMTGLMAETMLNPPLPWSLVVDNQRVEPSVRMFAEHISGDATYGDIPAGAPYWIANATDIETGMTFPFTQYQFDILCADLADYPIARAVAASSAIPGAVSAVAIRNAAPCPAQTDFDSILDSPLHYLTGYLRSGKGGLRGGDGASDMARALAAQSIMATCVEDEPCDRPDYIHLYDGGISDNVALGEPLWLLTGANAPWNEELLNYSNTPDETALRRVVVVTVNAASAPPSRIGQRKSSPSILTALRSVLGSAIDRRTIGLTAQLAGLESEMTGRSEDIKTSVESLSFPQIVDAACRARASAIGTNWGLARHEADAMLGIGAALAFNSKPFRDVAAVSIDDATWDEAARCHLQHACACLTDPESCTSTEIRFPAICSP